MVTRASAGAQAGNISGACFDNFVKIYCLQVYSLCREATDNGYQPAEEYLCLADCKRVIEVECASDWSILVETVMAVRQHNMATALPALKENCSAAPDTSNGAGTDEACLSLQSGCYMTVYCNVASIQQR